MGLAFLYKIGYFVKQTDGLLTFDKEGRNGGARAFAFAFAR
jgi:hypothetical protein